MYWINYWEEDRIGNKEIVTINYLYNDQEEKRELSIQS